MRISAYSVTASVAVLSATVFAYPALYKRVADGANVFSCFATALVTGTWSTDCAAASAVDVGIIQRVNVKDLLIDFTADDPRTLGLSSTGLSAKLISVPGIKWPVKDTAQHVTIVDNGNAIATFDTPTSAASVTDGTLSSVVGNSALKIPPGQEDNFSAFISALVSQPSYAFVLQGSVDATLSVSTPASPSLSGMAPSPLEKTFAVSNVGFKSPITLAACNNFPQVQYLSQASFTHDAATGEFTLTSLINIHNPSQLVLKLGDIRFNTIDKAGQVVGVTMLKDLELLMGDNKVVAITTSMNAEAYNTITTTGDTYTLVGFESSSANPILAKGLLSFKTQVVVPKLDPVA